MARRQRKAAKEVQDEVRDKECEERRYRSQFSYMKCILESTIIG